MLHIGAVAPRDDTARAGPNTHYTVAPSLTRAPAATVPPASARVTNGMEYGCTFSNCTKKFTNPPDWRMHEFEHKHKELFRCQFREPVADGKSCGVVLENGYLFAHHLLEEHDVQIDPQAVPWNGEFAQSQPLLDPNWAGYEALRPHCIGEDHRGQYWCGFCQKIFQCRADSGNPDTPFLPGERFRHVQGHFELGWATGAWVDAKANMTKADMAGFGDVKM